MANTCLMLAVITLCYFPYLVDYSFVFALTLPSTLLFEQVLSLWVDLEIL